jgi:hypothetical protein
MIMSHHLNSANDEPNNPEYLWWNQE